MRLADTVSCLWFEGEKQQETVLDVALLEKVSSRGAPHGGHAPCTGTAIVTFQARKQEITAPASMTGRQTVRGHDRCPGTR